MHVWAEQKNVPLYFLQGLRACDPRDDVFADILGRYKLRGFSL